MADVPDRHSVSEDDAHRILARAVELDARSLAELTIAQLRDAAKEAGIAEAAFDQAVEEVRATRAGHAELTTPRAQWLGRFAQLRRYRRYLAAACVVIAAAATRGDIVQKDLLLALFMYAPFGLAFYLAGPDSPRGESPSSPDTRGGRPESDAWPSDDTVLRRVIMRSVIAAPAI